MWKWDQGRLEYFQYDVLRTIARFVVKHDIKNSAPGFVRAETDLPFLAPATHSPWRNYSRIFKLCMLITEHEGVAAPTDVAKILAKSGDVTCDEYLHFIAEATTDPSPALSGWNATDPDSMVRHPLCFTLKYLLARMAMLNQPITPLNDVMRAYMDSGLSGQEDAKDFAVMLSKELDFSHVYPSGDFRQARESIKFISQISYLHVEKKDIIVSLSQSDAYEVFNALIPINVSRKTDGDIEIQRLAGLFAGKLNRDFLDYKDNIISDVIDSGFQEGTKVKKTHIAIERNAKLREAFFQQLSTSICDACDMDTARKYPWTKRVLDIHHVLPLSHGTRVDSTIGTLLTDIVPICPTCHRAVHRYYDTYLKDAGRKDFDTKGEARQIYSQAKEKIFRRQTFACKAEAHIPIRRRKSGGTGERAIAPWSYF